jgi:hypothetical protein
VAYHPETCFALRRAIREHSQAKALESQAWKKYPPNSG